MRLHVVAAALLAVACSSGCSLRIGAERIEARASLFAPLNRETRQEADSAVVEQTILAGLIREDEGRLDLARAYLVARGYSAQEVEQRLAIARARTAAGITPAR